MMVWLFSECCLLTAIRFISAISTPAPPLAPLPHPFPPSLFRPLVALLSPSLSPPPISVLNAD